MENPFKYSDTNKRYHTFDYYVKHRFGKKVVKVGLDGGFSCPNRDGTKGVGGCAFCGAGGAESLPLGRNEGLPPSLDLQYEQGRARLAKKWGNAPVIAYFQSYSSTHAPLSVLKELYERALSLEDVVGLTVSTRPDCLPRDVLEYLTELNQRTVLTVELGLQTTFDETARRMNRGHSYATFLEGYAALKERGIAVGVHLINGLPGEDREMMLENARRVGALAPDLLKIHSIYYRKGTALEKGFLRGEYTPMSLEEYVFLVADQLPLIPGKTVMERLTGDPLRSELVAPFWTADKKKVLSLLDRTLAERDIFQGMEVDLCKMHKNHGDISLF
ncbi:MAG: TIGR01212 family radical SAM protein [Clostridia bacterium]|nr:TIGR01212 family radical SAM protein [Clostridia bacterium]